MNNNYFNYYIQPIILHGKEGNVYYVLTDNPELEIEGLQRLEGICEYSYPYIYRAYQVERQGIFGIGRKINYYNLSELYVRGLLEMQGINYSMLPNGFNYGDA